MTFTVTYRGSNGALREECVEAASRAECLAECRRRGIAPTRIAEGKGAGCRCDVGVHGDGRIGALHSRGNAGDDSRRATARWVAATALIAVAVVVGVWWYMGLDNGGVSGTPRRSTAITPVKPKPSNVTVATKAPTPTVESKPAPPKVELPPQRVGELRDGYRLLPDGTMHRVLGIVTNTPPKMSLADKTFKHSADVELGNLLMVEPGDDVLGDGAGMYRGFGKELDEALAEPILSEDDDTDLQRELKAGVIELREELKRRRAAGEDIETIMEDTRNQLKELSLYRQELDEQVRKLSFSQATQKDYEDLVKAANEMLAERGVRPLELPTTLKRAMRLHQIQEQAEEREKTKIQSKEEQSKGTEE